MRSPPRALSSASTSTSDSICTELQDEIQHDVTRQQYLAERAPAHAGPVEAAP